MKVMIYKSFILPVHEEKTWMLLPTIAAAWRILDEKGSTQDFRPRVANFQNVNCFVFEQRIVFHKAAIQNVYNVNYFKT